MPSHRETIRLLPQVLKGLRRRAGHRSQRSAMRAIRRNTGHKITPTRLSHWELGRSLPSLRSLLALLEALGLDFRDFQDEIDRVAGPESASEPAPQPPTEAPEPASPPPALPPVEAARESGESSLAQRIEELEQRLRSLEDRRPSAS